MSKSPGLYFDIGREARELLYKDYAQQPPFHFNYECFDWSYDLSCRIGEIMPGLRTLVRCIIPNSSKAEVQYLHDYGGITGGVMLANPSREKGPIFNFSGLIGTPFFSLGTDVSYNLSTKMLKTFNAGLRFQISNLVSALTLNDKFENLNVSCHYTLNPLTNTAIACELKHSIANVPSTFLTLGVQHSLFPSTLLKARVNSYGKLGGVIEQGFWNKLYIAVSGEVNFLHVKQVPQLGLSLALQF